MVSKRDVFEGNIIPLYKDHQVQQGFYGMAYLVKKEDSKLIDCGSYIKEEKDSRDPNARFVCHSKIYHKENNQYSLKTINKVYSDHIVLIGDDLEEILIYKPYGNVLDRFEYGDTINIEQDDYQKTWVAVKDTATHVTLVSQRDFLEEKSSSLLKLKKPFLFKKEMQEPFTYVWNSERWKVNVLDNPFLGSLGIGQIVYYKDRGVYEVEKIHESRVCLKPRIEGGISVECAPLDLYTPEKIKFTTHAWISYPEISEINY